MNGTSGRLLIGLGVLLIFAPGARSQEAPAKPLGDVAREQQAAHKQQKKASAQRRYRDMEAAPTATTAQTESVNAPSSPQPGAESKAAASSKLQLMGTERIQKPARRSIFDQTHNTKPDVIIVPAGTEIRVDIVEGKVVVPVRVGFATPIPALSQAAVKVNQVYFAPVFYAMSASNAPVAYGETGELTAVTVRGVTYPVHANRVQLNSSGVLNSAMTVSSTRDAVFVLSAPLAIER